MLTAAKAVRATSPTKEEVHANFEKPFILHDFDGVNLSPASDINIIVYIPASGCTCF